MLLRRERSEVPRAVIRRADMMIFTDPLFG
jgi:hypothetical protein